MRDKQIKELSFKQKGKLVFTVYILIVYVCMCVCIYLLMCIFEELNYKGDIHVLENLR